MSDDQLQREIQIMQASGWQLYGRFPGGADFVQRSTSGVSGVAHVVLLIITAGLWLPVLIVVEAIAAIQGSRYQRLTFDSQGQPHYEAMRKPAHRPGASLAWPS